MQLWNKWWIKDGNSDYMMMTVGWPSVDLWLTSVAFYHLMALVVDLYVASGPAHDKMQEKFN